MMTLTDQISPEAIFQEVLELLLHKTVSFNVEQSKKRSGDGYEKRLMTCPVPRMLTQGRPPCQAVSTVPVT